MSKRFLGPLAAATLCFTSHASAQGAATKEPEADGRTLSQWVADLKAVAPQIRNAAAYEISGMPKLKKMMDEEINDEIAAGARRALKRIQPDAVVSGQ